MTSTAQSTRYLIAAGCLALLATSATPLYAANPCGAKNPCSPKAMEMHNPCSMKNPCAPKTKAMNPCGAKNPCAQKPAMNPCAAKSVTRPSNYKPYKGDAKALLAKGAILFQDTRLSPNGMSCNTCHNNHGAFQATFAEPYPHAVQMAKDQFKLKTVHADEMVQLCMVSPMAAKPLPWDSKELAALTAYVLDQQKGFASMHKTGMKNPCGAKNPCAPKTMNPCSVKKSMNPCSVKKSMNPCSAKPMNPCAGK